MAEGGEELPSFRVVDVYLSDQVSSLLVRRSFLSSGEDNDKGGGGGGGEEEEPVLDESMFLQMSNLGLPTSFSSGSRSRSFSHRSRRNRKSGAHDQVTASLISDVVSTPFEKPPFLVDSLQMSMVDVVEDDGVRVSNNQENHCADANTLAATLVSTDDGLNDTEATASSSELMVAASASVQTLELAGNFVSALGALLSNRGSSDEGIAESMEVMAESTDKVLEDEAACLEKDDCTVIKGGSSSTDSESLSIIALNLQAVNLVTAPDSARSVTTANDMLVEVAEQDSYAKDSQIPDAGSCDWSPHWDSNYGRYCFYNAKTQELTWEAPKGFEPYVSISFLQGGNDNTATNCISTDCVAESRQEIDSKTVDLRHVASYAEVSTCSKDFGTAEIVAKGGDILTTSDNVTLLVKDASTSGTVSDHGEIAALNDSELHARKDDITDSTRSPYIAMGIIDVQGREMEPSVKELSAIDPKSTRLEEHRKWSALWDDYYGRHFFYNTETLESTWEPPKGFEAYANIESNCLLNDKDSVPKEGKAESDLDDRSKRESLLEVVGMVSNSRDPTHHDGINKNRSEEQAVLSLEGMAGQEDFIETNEGQGVSMGVSIHVEVGAVGRRAKRAAHQFLGLANKALETVAASPNISKYWYQRFHLFSKYDSGIKLDEEGWFSVTPEAIAKHQAGRCKGDVIVDAFTGVGGNAIQFALAGHFVVAIDNDSKRLGYAHHNAKVYGVADRIDFVLGDFFKVSSSIRADVIFLSPPWGGPDYLDAAAYDILTMLQPKDAVTLLNAAQLVAPNIMLFLPRNVDMEQLSDLQKSLPFLYSCEVERNFLNRKLKAVTAYFGQFASVEKFSGK